MLDKKSPYQIQEPKENSYINAAKCIKPESTVNKYILTKGCHPQVREDFFRICIKIKR